MKSKTIIIYQELRNDCNSCNPHEAKQTSIENRIYIRGEFTRKKCKTAILLYCFYTAGVLHIFMLYNLWVLEYHFTENELSREHTVLMYSTAYNLGTFT